MGSLGSHVTPILSTSFRASQEPHVAVTALVGLSVADASFAGALSAM
jgi:hypothetical protein